MYNSILQFSEQCSEKLKIVNLILNSEADINVLTETVQKQVLKLGTGIIKEFIERNKYHTAKSKSKTKQLFDVIAIINYVCTGYEDKKTGDYVYLVDRIMGIETHQRLTLAAETSC